MWEDFGTTLAGSVSGTASTAYSALQQITPASIRASLGITRPFSFSLIAIGFAAPDDADSVTLEFAGGPTTYAITGKALKPARVRVPDKNYVAKQWFTYDGTNITGMSSTFASNQPLATLSVIGVAQGNASSNAKTLLFVDVAIRY